MCHLTAGEKRGNMSRMKVRGRTTIDRMRQGAEILENVNKQKDAVKEALTNGDRRKAWRFARQLVVSQQDNSKPQQIAMSLCDLSQHAKRLGDTFLHLHFSLWAVRECASDAWAHHQVGDAYNMMGQMNER